MHWFGVLYVMDWCVAFTGLYVCVALHADVP